jgi:uncharacterized protein (DUF433 family)
MAEIHWKKYIHSDPEILAEKPVTRRTRLSLDLSWGHLRQEGPDSSLTEDYPRASHRALNEAPFNNLDLLSHRQYKSDLGPIPAGQPVQLVFDLLPTLYLFRVGSRIRNTVTCADADNFETPGLDLVPKIHLLGNTAHASFVEFPIILVR